MRSSVLAVAPVTGIYINLQFISVFDDFDKVKGTRDCRYVVVVYAGSEEEVLRRRKLRVAPVRADH